MRTSTSTITVHPPACSLSVAADPGAANYRTATCRTPNGHIPDLPGGTTCTFHVTYSWSGVSGPTDAFLRVLYQIPGQLFSATAASGNVAVSGRSGTAVIDLPVSGQGAQAFYGRGSLYDRKNQEITGSQATSITSITATC